MNEKFRLVTGQGAWHTSDGDGEWPSLHLSDGPHGLRIPLSDSTSMNNRSKPATCYPTASAMACSWDRELVRKMANGLAQEARTNGVHVVLGPGVNMKRSPLCGRNFEYYSEDPYLAGELGTAYVQAMQAQGVGTSLKHFAGNSQETHRMTSNSEIDERALHEIYLAAFEAVVKQAHPYTVMASYNRLNGIYACENRHLLTEILREDWGFDGLVVSDWGACVDLANCLAAGMDLEMPGNGGLHLPALSARYEDGTFPEEHLDRAVGNLRKLIDRTTITSTSSTIQPDKAVNTQNSNDFTEDFHALACDLSTESAVLLQNDGMLPLAPCKVLVIGDLAKEMRFQGGGSSHITTEHAENALDCLTDLGFDVTYARGYDAGTEKVSETLEQEALSAAQTGLPILFFGGLTDRTEGEGYDRTTLAMPENQLHLLDILTEKTNHITFVSFGGSPMLFPFRGRVRSILHMGLGGEGTGKACADLITGRKNPCGKLAETYPAALEDIPCLDTFGKDTDDVEYRESLFIGYRYYDSYGVPVQFPFGYGLSYTTFAYSDLRITNTEGKIIDRYDGQDALLVHCKVTNTGTAYGKEIVQLYVENPHATYLRPKKELRQFAKVALEPGETKEVCMALNPRSFSIYDDRSRQFLMPSGDYQIQVAASIEEVRLSAPLAIDGVDYERDDTERLREYFRQDETPGFHISQAQFAALYGKPLSDFDHTPVGGFTVKNSLQQLAKHSLLGKLFLRIAKRIGYKMFPGKPKDDPEVLMTIRGIEEGSIDSVLCQCDGAVPYKVGEAIVLSANKQHRKAWAKLLRG